MLNASLAQVAQLRWSSTGTITSAEGACEHVLGRSAAALEGLNVQEALGTTGPRLAELATDLAGTGSPHIDFIQGRLNGHPRVFRLVCETEAGGAVTACVLDVEDILENAPPVQISRLSSSLSHEIRNPLSSVKMAVQTVARNPGLSERDQRRLAIANREVRTVERMLWLLSEYGRDSHPALEPAPLRAVVHEASALVGSELAERKVLLRIDEPPDVPRARVDAGRLRPVLAQLLLNVAMGQPENSTLVVTLVSAASTPEGAGARLVLDDATATLPVEEKESVFKPFGSMLARGAGLSLAALYQVMKGHGGDVTAEAIDPGTRYTLKFPPL
jgi:two-component system, NtrC family, sensor histidine kinase HydH